MKPFDDLLKDIEFEASADYDMQIEPKIAKSIDRLKSVGAPDAIIEMFKMMLRESFINGAKEGFLLTIEIANKEL